MTEPRVEAGDRALETARKCVEMAQGYASDAGILDSIELEGHVAVEIQSAMNAETTLLKKIAETVDLLPSITGISPVKNRYEDIPMAIRELQQAYQDASRARNGEAGPLLRRQAAQHKAELAAMNAQEREWRQDVLAFMESKGWDGAVAIFTRDFDKWRAERLLSERGDTK